MSLLIDFIFFLGGIRHNYWDTDVNRVQLVLNFSFILFFLSLSSFLNLLFHPLSLTLLSFFPLSPLQVDWNNDGCMDIYMLSLSATESDTIYLWDKQTNKFDKEVTGPSTWVYDFNQSSKSSGLDISRYKFGDFDGNGFVDVYLVNFNNDSKKEGNGLFLFFFVLLFCFFYCFYSHLLIYLFYFFSFCLLFFICVYSFFSFSSLLT